MSVKVSWKSSFDIDELDRLLFFIKAHPHGPRSLSAVTELFQTTLHHL